MVTSKYEDLYIGIDAENQPLHSLILGESHHGEGTYTTGDIVYDYLENPSNRYYEFFDKIVKSFGMNPDERDSFWKRFLFKNYLPIKCDIGSTTAEAFLDVETNREVCNQTLFNYINEFKIDRIFCFSRLSYKKLPKLKENEIETHIAAGYVGTQADRIDKCIYYPGIHSICGNVNLQRNVTVYGFRHPSGQSGFRSENYAPIMKDKL